VYVCVDVVISGWPANRHVVRDFETMALHDLSALWPTAHSVHCKPNMRGLPVTVAKLGSNLVAYTTGGACLRGELAQWLRTELSVPTLETGKDFFQHDLPSWFASSCHPRHRGMLRLAVASALSQDSVIAVSGLLTGPQVHTAVAIPLATIDVAARLCGVNFGSCMQLFLCGCLSGHPPPPFCPLNTDSRFGHQPTLRAHLALATLHHCRFHHLPVAQLRAP
jgi:hypothetical protein